jgi:DNA invertase Pin-like site-specific DNA recombinase
VKMGGSKKVRCAIYTRVSTDQGLEQDFNSLDAQYDASQAYIRSQQHAGWTMVRSKYDDGGFSGGNTDRPALQRLLEKSKPRQLTHRGSFRAAFGGAGGRTRHYEA